MTIVTRLIIVLSFLPLLGFCQVEEIRTEVIGIDAKKLIYQRDFTVELMADGHRVGADIYQVASSPGGTLIIDLPEDHGWSTLRLLLQLKEYQGYTKNIFLKGAGKEPLILADFHPTPHAVVISDVRYYDVGVGNDEQMVFEITLRNNSKEEVLLRKLQLRAGIEASCASPDPAFAKIQFNNDIQFYTQADTNNLTSTVLNNQGQQVKVRGSLNYHACGTQEMSLEMNTASIIPDSKFSKMFIQFPNQLTFYEHQKYEEAPLGIQHRVRSTKVNRLENIHTIFQEIPDVNFVFTFVSDREWKVETLLNSYFDY